MSRGPSDGTRSRCGRSPAAFAPFLRSRILSAYWLRSHALRASAASLPCRVRAGALQSLPQSLPSVRWLPSAMFASRIALEHVRRREREAAVVHRLEDRVGVVVGYAVISTRWTLLISQSRK